MNGFDLLQAMEHINEGLIEETYRHKRASRSAKWRVAVSFAASVACILLILAILLLPEQWSSSQKANSGLGNGIFSRENGVLPMSAIWEMEKILAGRSEDGVTKEMEKACNEVLQKYGVPLTYSPEEAVGGTYVVMDNDGSISYNYEHYIGYDTTKKEWICQPTLIHRITGEMYSLGISGEGWNLDHFLNTTRWKNVYVEETIMEAQKILEDEEYLSIEVDSSYDGDVSDGTPHVFVMLGNDAIHMVELEKLQISYNIENITLDEVRERIRKLWERKEELGILDITVQLFRDSEVSLLLRTKFTEDKVYELLTEEEKQYVTVSWYGVLKTDADLRCARGIEDLDEFMAFVTEYDSNWINQEDKQAKKDYEAYSAKLKKALQVLKAEYPEYSYLQLYYHVANDTDYSCYLYFDEKLEAFVESLDIYKAEKYFTEEVVWGDAEMLELKRMLKQYKQLYPNLSYEELYEKCGYKNFLKNDPIATNYERLMWSLNQKYHFGEEKQKVERDKEIAAVIACLASVVIVVLVQWKKRSGMKRELLALVGNMLLYVVLPACLAGAPDALGAVMIPNYYLTPLFVLVAMLWYRFKGGKYWRFMIYTGACILVEAFAIIDFSPLYTLLIPAVICEAVILVCGDRLIDKIKKFLDIAD